VELGEAGGEAAAEKLEGLLAGAVAGVEVVDVAGGQAVGDGLDLRLRQPEEVEAAYVCGDMLSGECFQDLIDDDFGAGVGTAAEQHESGRSPKDERLLVGEVVGYVAETLADIKVATAAEFLKARGGVGDQKHSLGDFSDAERADDAVGILPDYRLWHADVLADKAKSGVTVLASIRTQIDRGTRVRLEESLEAERVVEVGVGDYCAVNLGEVDAELFCVGHVGVRAAHVKQKTLAFEFDVERKPPFGLEFALSYVVSEYCDFHFLFLFSTKVLIFSFLLLIFTIFDENDLNLWLCKQYTLLRSANLMWLGLAKSFAEVLVETVRTRPDRKIMVSTSIVLV